MNSLRTATSQRSRALKVLATVLAGIVVLVLANLLQGGGNSATDVSTSSLLPLVATDNDRPAEQAPTTIATTAPVLVPTATASPVPTATSLPEPSPTPAPTATLAPPPTSVVVDTAEGSVAVAGSESRSDTAAETAPAQAAPTTPVPATPIPATPIPEPTATAVVVPTVEPLAEPTVVVEPTPEPTATPEPTPAPALDIAGLEAYVLGQINQVRANAGLSAVALDPTISAISRDWSQQMASAGFFSHRPSSELNVMLPAGWRQWGENIASAPDIFYAQSSLEASPGHYANMVGDFTVVGIGVYSNGSQVWVTQNFARY